MVLCKSYVFLPLKLKQTQEIIRWMSGRVFSICINRKSKWSSTQELVGYKEKVCSLGGQSGTLEHTPQGCGHSSKPAGIQKSQNQGMSDVGRALWQSSSPTPVPGRVT